MFLLVLIACLSTASTAAATNSTKDAAADSTPATNATKEILKASETGDPTKVEIVKQIKRLNDDGSYTIGYEADDGTFKIESRDVLGNVKGTFGYIDKDGEIKRVTYSSSSDSTPAPVPVTTSTTPSTPMMIVRVNKTVSSTTRRPLGTIVYPTRTSFTTRGNVIQPIPRRRPILSSRTTTSTAETTTEKQAAEETTSNILNLYKPKSEESGKTRTQILKPMSATGKDELTTRQTTAKTPQMLKPLYEYMSIKGEADTNKANTIRRELTGTSPNPHMISLRQSAGDDSTDVYGSHLSLGTVRPLFTTTTPRPRLVPIHSLVAARDKIHQQYQEVPTQEQESTVGASTGRVFNHENVVTSNPVPVIHIPPHREIEERLYQQPIYNRQPAAVQFRTNEYLKDNPGAPVPIGNQRPFLHYEYQNKVLDSQFPQEAATTSQTKGTTQEPVTVPYEVRPVTRIIPISVDERGVPIHGYQARFVNPYRPAAQPLVYQSRYDPVDEMNAISAPVSTSDLKRLLHILILRQNRLQALMDQLVAPGPPYQPLHLYRQEPQYFSRYDNMARRYQDDDRYDYRYDQQQYRQQESYSKQVSNYDSPYESQRYVPRRRQYRPYDTESSSSNRIEEPPEYLPPEIREALLLKMLMLAINPDFVPTPVPPTELTTASPPRKQVRNVQILGEEGSEDAKRPVHT